MIEKFELITQGIKTPEPITKSATRYGSTLQTSESGTTAPQQETGMVNEPVSVKSEPITQSGSRYGNTGKLEINSSESDQ